MNFGGFLPPSLFPLPNLSEDLQQKCLPSYLTTSLFFHPAQPPEPTFALKGVLGQPSNPCCSEWNVGEPPELSGDRQTVLPRLQRANVPAQHSCCSPSHLWHKGLTEPYNALCSQRHSAAQAVLQTLVEAHRREIFCPSLVYTALSVASVSQTRQVHRSHPDIPAWARKSPQHQPKHNHAGTELQEALPPPLLTTT